MSRWRDQYAHSPVALTSRQSSASVVVQPYQLVSNQAADRWVISLFVLALLQVSLPPIINGLLGAGGFRLVAAAANTPEASNASDLIRVLLIALSFVSIGWCVLHRRVAAQLWQLIVVLAPFTYLFFRSLYVSSSTVGSYLAFASVLLAMWALRPSIGVLSFIGHAVGWVSIFSLGLGLAFPSIGTFVDQAGEAISLDKWSPLGTLLRGVFSHPNTLGQFLAIGIWVVFLVRSVPLRRFYALTCIVALLWTGSRTALLVTVLLLALAIGLRAMPWTAARPAGIILAAAALTVFVVATPLTNRDPAAYSYRGQIWLGSLEAWSDSPLFGLGGDWYFYIAGYSNQLIAAAFHGHNAFVHYATTGGVVLLVLAGIGLPVVVACAAQFARLGIMWPGMCVLSVIALSSQEVPLNFSQLTATGPVTWFLLALLILCQRPRLTSVKNVNFERSVIDAE